MHSNKTALSDNGLIKVVLCILNEECWFSGDNESGKTTLVSKLQGVEDQKKGSALEFMYVTVRDEYGDGELIYFCCVYTSLEL